MEQELAVADAQEPGRHFVCTNQRAAFFCVK